MFQELIQESWVYQELGENSFERGLEKGLEQGLEKGLEKGLEQGLQKGRVEGRVQEQRQMLMSFLQTRFPETLALANQQTNSINDPEVLRTVINKLFAAQSVEEARQILLEVNKQ
jgi:flagellar biosynthesis/type III secretory pathway protein FliH